MSPNKIINIEILRSFAVLSVILIHMSMGHFYDSNLMNVDILAWVVNNIYYTITRFCVPIFFIIAAFLVYNEKSSSTWKGKLFRIAVPYIIWSSIYYYYLGGGDIEELIAKIFTSNTSFHLWFLPHFLGFVILLPAIKMIFDSLEDRKHYMHVSVLLFIFSIIMPSLITLINYLHPGYGFLNGVSNFGFTLPGLLIFAFAFPYMSKKINPGTGLLIYAAIISLNLLLNIFISEHLSKPNEYFYGYSTPLVFISSFVLFNVIMSTDFSFLPNWIVELIYSVGSCSFGIYLVHWLMYRVLSEYGFTMRGMPIIDPVINTSIVFLASFLFIFIIRKLKFFRYIC